MIHEEHHKYTKFLWVSENRDKLTSYQFKVVIFGACSSPYILQQVLETHLADPKRVVRNLASNFYVDNFSKTYPSVESAILEKPLIDEIMHDAFMPLQGWVSSSCRFNQHFNITESSVQNMLGRKWDTVEDELSLSLSKKFPVNVDEWVPTKRNLLRAVASIFDPLGLVGPLTVVAKIHMQELWRCKYSWDQRLSDQLTAEARKLFKDLSNVTKFSFPRYIINDSCSLQVFSDASSKAYGVDVYSYSSFRSNFIVNKQRVAPCNRKSLIILKLELTGVLIGCRLIRHLSNLFRFTELVL